MNCWAVLIGGFLLGVLFGLLIALLKLQKENKSSFKVGDIVTYHGTNSPWRKMTITGFYINHLGNTMAQVGDGSAYNVNYLKKVQ